MVTSTSGQRLSTGWTAGGAIILQKGLFPRHRIRQVDFHAELGRAQPVEAGPQTGQ